VKRIRQSLALLLVVVGQMTAASARAGDTDDSTASAPLGTKVDPHDAQNPVASVISLPFQNNTNFDTGPYHKTEDILIVEPVIPFKLSEDWNLITRTIVPLAELPQLQPNHGSTFGLGNIEPQFYVSPAHPGNFIWGAGAQLWLPTATDDALGVNHWGAGPAFAGLTIQGPWVVGALANNIWVSSSSAGSDRRRVNELTVNPFINFNLPGGWYLSTSPVITADWTAKPNERWTVPLGGGAGRLFRIGGLPVNARVQLLSYVVRPTYTPSWLMQAQIQLLFPTSRSRH
jgi:hypothetical protein